MVVNGGGFTLERVKKVDLVYSFSIKLSFLFFRSDG